MIKKIVCSLFLAVWVFASPGFKIEGNLVPQNDKTVLRINLGVPANSYIYQHSLKVGLPEGGTAELLEKISDKPVDYQGDLVFKKSSVLFYALNHVTLPLQVSFGYQGCLEDVCLMPAEVQFKLGGSSVSSMPPTPGREKFPDANAQNFAGLARNFEEIGRISGYHKSDDFISWIQKSLKGESLKEENLLQKVSGKYGLLLAALLVIPLGLMLNLTPCVLPMIPINLSIIGAGAHSKAGKGRGGLLGGLYGGAMALVYGAIGAVVVKTGSQFGTINSSPWFNLAVAVVFIVLALAMFDVFLLDFSRFKHQGKRDGSPYVTAVILGGVSALLAGACVAPVLIWVLLLAADLQAKGNAFGIFLPLLLGIGMGLPWPFLGAGISKMPKPGMWMVYVKKAMGGVILLFACYYIWLAVQIFRKPEIKMAGWENNLEAAMEQAQLKKKVILLDFWGIACKSCAAMKKTTLKDQKVLDNMKDFIKVEFQADDLDDPDVKKVLDYYRIAGLPTFILLQPR